MTAAVKMLDRLSSPAMSVNNKKIDGGTELLNATVYSKQLTTESMETEDVGSIQGVGKKFYISLYTDFLLKFLQHSPWTQGFSIFLSFF